MSSLDRIRNCEHRAGHLSERYANLCKRMARLPCYCPTMEGYLLAAEIALSDAERVCGQMEDWATREEMHR